jgi:PST family polysaccharide transporter
MTTQNTHSKQPASDNTNTLAKRVAGHIKAAEGILSNVSWMLASEVVARGSRLVTIIALAALLSTTEYGYAMLALVCHELMRIFTRIGSGSKLIQCDSQDLPRFAGNAYTLNWLIAVSLAAIQYFAAPLIAELYNAPELISLLRIMAISYLIYPLVAIRVYLLQRNNQMKYYSLCSGLSISVDNLGTALFVCLGFGIESVAYAKVLAALVWVCAFAKAKTERYTPQCSISTMLVLISFSCRVLGSELLKALRTQADLLIAGKLLAPELFGLYSFAKSAGIGLAQSLGNAFLAGVYPRLANYHRNGEMQSGSKLVINIALAVGAIFILQSLASLVYVPLLFNEQWHDASAMVAVLCLSAIPALLLDTNALIARIEYKLNTEVALQLTAVIWLVAGIIIVKPDTPWSFAITTTALSSGWLLIAAGHFFRQRLTPFFFWSTAS